MICLFAKIAIFADKLELVMGIWQNIKNLYTGESRTFTWFVTLWLLYFAWSWLFGSGNTIPQYLESKKEIRGQLDSIEYYQNDIRRLDDILSERESNLDVLEKFAREQYNFAAKNEDVYIIE